jgi:hypothetical protein
MSRPYDPHKFLAAAIRCATLLSKQLAAPHRLSITHGVNGGNSVVCDVPTKMDFAATA